MNAAQREFVRRTIRNLSLIALLAIIFSVVYEWMLLDWVSSHREGASSVALVLFVIAAGLARHSKRIPTSAQRHAAFNEVMDDYPFLKMFYVVYAIAIVIGLFFMLLKHIYLVDILDKTGFFGLAGPILLLMVPVGIAKFLRSYEEAGWADRER